MAFIFLFSNWTPPWLKNATGLHMNGAGQVHTNKSDQTHYIGSIILSPKHGGKCWERKLDNRNGAMWDKGYVKCDIYPPLNTLQTEAVGLAARRIKAIGQAFAPTGN